MGEAHKAWKDTASMIECRARWANFDRWSRFWEFSAAAYVLASVAFLAVF